MTWTPELVERLRELWAEGHSTAEIGRMIGLSKNAVVGKAHRMKLPPRQSSPRKAKPVIRRVRVHAGKGPACQWPIGDPRSGDFHFCGAPAVPGKPYCEEHCAMAFTRSNSGSNEAANTEKAA